MGAKSAFSVTKALGAAVAFVPRAIAGAWLVMAMSLLVFIAGHHLVMGLAPHRPFGLLLHVVIFLVKLVMIGGLYRLALFGTGAKDEGLGFGGVQIGWPELRLFVADIIVALFALVIMIALFIVFAVAFETSGLGTGYANTREAVLAMVCRHATVADWIVIAYGVAALVFMVFVALKFTLVHAATVAQHRIVTLNALGLSSGNTGKLFLGLVAILAPFAILWLVVLHLFGPPAYLPLLPHLASPGIRLGLHLLVLVLATTVLGPLLVGFFASAYRQIVANRAR